MSHRRHAAVLLALGLAAGTCAVAIAPASTHAEFLPGITQVVVRIDPARVTVGEVNDVVGATTAGASVAGNGTYLIDLPAGADAEAAVATIDTLPGVVYAVPNTSLTPPEIDASRIYAWRIYAWSEGSPTPTASAYADDAVRLAGAHDISIGRGVVVAVLDTGVGPHTALDGALLPGVDLVDGDAVASDTANGIDDDGDGLVDEGAGHGTHVAGVVHHVAPGASILPIRVLDDEGSGTMWTAVEGMYIAADRGADIVNMSLGTHGSAEPLRAAVAELAAKGVVVVAAAGNDGKDRRMFPAAAPAAIAVGSVGAGDVVSTFSNFGRWIDVVAPGEEIHSTFPFPADSYAANSGTSMATPWVSGEAALVLAHRPLLSPDEVTSAIKAGADGIATDVALQGQLGAGRIDISATLRAL